MRLIFFYLIINLNPLQPFQYSLRIHNWLVDSLEKEGERKATTIRSPNQKSPLPNLIPPQVAEQVIKNKSSAEDGFTTCEFLSGIWMI